MNDYNQGMHDIINKALEKTEAEKKKAAGEALLKAFVHYIISFIFIALILWAIFALFPLVFGVTIPYSPWGVSAIFILIRSIIIIAISKVEA